VSPKIALKMTKKNKETAPKGEAEGEENKGTLETAHGLESGLTLK
jgi:hypothetical protein